MKVAAIDVSKFKLNSLHNIVRVTDTQAWDVYVSRRTTRLGLVSVSAEKVSASPLEGLVIVSLRLNSFWRCKVYADIGYGSRVTIKFSSSQSTI